MIGYFRAMIITNLIKFIYKRSTYLVRLMGGLIYPKAVPAARPHQGSKGHTTIPQEKRPMIKGPSRLVSIPILGGLHHRYQQVAA
jgi:hypothetical protein